MSEPYCCHPCHPCPDCTLAMSLLLDDCPGCNGIGIKDDRTCPRCRGCGTEQ